VLFVVRDGKLAQVPVVRGARSATSSRSPAT
jgi:hypothetical protein